jgi:hypothetical protein
MAQELSSLKRDQHSFRFEAEFKLVNDLKFKPLDPKVYTTSARI